MTAWQVQLEGDVRDLDFLANIFTAGARKVIRDEMGPGYLYESDSFHPCSTSEEVAQLAEGEVAVLSGILKLEHSARDVLRCNAVYRPIPNGGRHVFVRCCETIRIGLEMGAATALVTDSLGNVINRPAPPPRFVTLMTLSETDAAIAKILRLLSAPDAMTWVGLYRIHEVIEKDMGGQHMLEKQSWCSAAELRRFRHSANSVQVGGDHSRHGKEHHEPPKNPMSLAEAEAYAKFIVQAWLTSKGA